jgi:NADH-quinone oxidoreductase subunit L
MLVIYSVAVSLGGIFLAWLFYVAKPGLAGAFAARAGALYKLVYNKYFVDEIYDTVVVEPVVGGSRSVLWKRVDVGIIDGAVNGIAYRVKGVGNVLRLLQSGNIRTYAAWVLLGSLIMLAGIGFGGLR